MAEVKTIATAVDGRKAPSITLKGDTITAEIVAKWNELKEFRLTTQKGEESVRTQLDLPDYMAQVISETHRRIIVEGKL